MKRTLTAVSIFVAAQFLIACHGHDDDEHSHEAESHEAENHEAESHEASEHGSEPIERLALNDGQKWEMDAHTRTVFADMASSFLETDVAGKSAEERQKAGADLRTLTNKLIQGCTMTGAAHDQLHVYLSGYVPAVGKLAKSGEVEDAERVKRYLKTYPEFFE